MDVLTELYVLQQRDQQLQQIQTLRVQPNLRPKGETCSWGWFPSMHHRSHDQGVCIQVTLHPAGGICIRGGSASEGRGPASGGLPPEGSASRGVGWGGVCLGGWADPPPPPRYMGYYRIPVAPTLRGGGWQHMILPNSPKNCMKLKEFGPLRSVTGSDAAFEFTPI